MVELKRIGPAGKVRVPAVGDDPRAGDGIGAPVVLWLAGEVHLVSEHAELGMLMEPRGSRASEREDRRHRTRSDNDARDSA